MSEISKQEVLDKLESLAERIEKEIERKDVYGKIEYEPLRYDFYRYTKMIGKDTLATMDVEVYYTAPTVFSIKVCYEEYNVELDKKEKEWCEKFPIKLTHFEDIIFHYHSVKRSGKDTRGIINSILDNFIQGSSYEINEEFDKVLKMIIYLYMIYLAKNNIEEVYVSVGNKTSVKVGRAIIEKDDIYLLYEVFEELKTN